MKKVEFLIVGQGLAGTVLAYEMLKHKVSFHVISSPSKSTASKVAAGMVNPLVFKRLTKSWMADDLIPLMIETYKTFENLLGNKFFYKKDILKPLSEQEKQLWTERSKLPDFKKYITKITDKPSIQHISDASGYGLVTMAGYLQISKFLKLSKKFFYDRQLISDIDFTFGKIDTKKGIFDAGVIKADKIVFCEGTHLLENPFFQFVKMNPVKGEVLQIFAPSLSEEYILNKGVFVLPVGNHRFKVGSTYEWDDLSDLPTEKGRQSITERLEKLITINYTVENHWAGVRPAMIDRRPVLGSHPQYERLFIFNGLGAKGVMLAPYFANEMIKICTLRHYAPDREISLNRFLLNKKTIPASIPGLFN